MEVLVVLGLIIYIIGSISLLIAEFKTSIAWGLLGILFQFPHLFFAILHFDTAKGSLAIMLLGFCIILFAKMM